MTETFYDAVGGTDTFRRLVHRFYEQVATDPDFRALYPEEDLGPAEERLRMFLEQYWGGPNTYHQLRGHPRLRIRHHPFRITTAERDTWLKYMLTSLDELQLAPELDEPLRDYLTRTANFLVNTLDTPEPPSTTFGAPAVPPVIS